MSLASLLAAPNRMFRLATMTWHKLQGLWDKLSIYLPLALMGLLALGTYWLIRNTPAFLAPEVTRPVVHEVDYFMRRATVKTFDETGRLKSEIFGVEARHYPDTETLEIDQVRVRSVGAEGRVTASTANRGLSNDEGSEVQLMGNAIVVREPIRKSDGSWVPRMEFRGEFLHIYVNDERVKSHLPVLLIRGSDQFSGDTFAYDHLNQAVELKGRVKGILMPGNRSTAATAPFAR